MNTTTDFAVNGVPPWTVSDPNGPIGDPYTVARLAFDTARGFANTEPERGQITVRDGDSRVIWTSYDPQQVHHPVGQPDTRPAELHGEPDLR